jgi:hypothetical protein
VAEGGWVVAGASQVRPVEVVVVDSAEGLVGARAAGSAGGSGVATAAGQEEDWVETRGAGSVGH